MYDRLRQANRDLNMAEYESGQSRLQSMPRMLFVELTQNCNLHCNMCRDVRRYDESKDMPFELFCQIADELFPYAEWVDLRGWGESTIMRRFLDYVEYAARFGCKYKLYTNMAKPDAHLWETLIRTGFTLAVSFDGSSAGTFEEVRGGANFRVVTDNLRHAVKLRDRFGRRADSLYLSTTVQRANLSEVPSIVEFAADVGLTLVKLFPVIKGSKSPIILDPLRNEVVRILDTTFETARKLGVVVELGAALHPDLALPEHAVDSCIHPWSYCLIDYKGGIGFCDHLIGTDRYILGQFRPGAFREEWNNVRFVKLRAEHVGASQNPFSEEFTPCNWCYRYRYVDMEHVLHPRHARRVVSSAGTETPYRLCGARSWSRSFRHD